MSLAFLETFILSFIHHRHVPSLKVILHIQSHLYNPKIVSQPFANNICKSSNPRPPITGLYVFENSLYLLFLQKFQVCCTSRNSFMAIVTFHPIQQRERAFLDHQAITHCMLSKQLFCSLLFTFEEENEMDVAKGAEVSCL